MLSVSLHPLEQPAGMFRQPETALIVPAAIAATAAAVAWTLNARSGGGHALLAFVWSLLCLLWLWLRYRSWLGSGLLVTSERSVLVRSSLAASVTQDVPHAAVDRCTVEANFGRRGRLLLHTASGNVDAGVVAKPAEAAETIWQMKRRAQGSSRADG